MSSGALGLSVAEGVGRDLIQTQGIEVAFKTRARGASSFAYLGTTMEERAAREGVDLAALDLAAVEQRWDEAGAAPGA